MKPAFAASQVSTAEIERLEAVHGPLTERLRHLIDVAIRTTVDEHAVHGAIADVERAIERLSASLEPGPAGVHFNEEGRLWSWGNAVIGVRNAIAPPLEPQRTEDGAWAEVTLGPAYEGPPGMVHGGVLALLLDHLMGVASSTGGRFTMTGSLTLNYRRPTPLGRVRIEGRLARTEGRKVIVEAHIADADGATTVEAEGLFIAPSWSLDPDASGAPSDG